MNAARRSGLFRNAPRRLVDPVRNGDRRRRERAEARAADVAAREIERLLPEAIRILQGEGALREAYESRFAEIRERFSPMLTTKRACEDFLEATKSLSGSYLTFSVRRMMASLPDGGDGLPGRAKAELSNLAEAAKQPFHEWQDAFGAPRALLADHIAAADAATCLRVMHAFQNAGCMAENSALGPLQDRLEALGVDESEWWVSPRRNGQDRRRRERAEARAADVAAEGIRRAFPGALEAVAAARKAHDELDAIEREIVERYFERLDTSRACNEALDILHGAGPTLLAFLRDRRDYVVPESRHGTEGLEPRLASDLRKDAERAGRAYRAWSEANDVPLRLLGGHIECADGPTCQALFRRFVEALSIDGNSAVFALLKRLQDLGLKPDFGGPGGQR